MIDDDKRFDFLVFEIRGEGEVEFLDIFVEKMVRKKTFQISVKMASKFCIIGLEGKLKK